MFIFRWSTVNVCFPAGRSLTPARPVLHKRSLEKVVSPSQSRSYMSPTTSSMAKAIRDSCESLSIPANASFLTNASKTLPSKAVRPRVRRSASSQELRADPALKAFSSAPDDPGLQRRRSSSSSLVWPPSSRFLSRLLALLQPSVWFGWVHVSYSQSFVTAGFV